MLAILTSSFIARVAGAQVASKPLPAARAAPLASDVAAVPSGEVGCEEDEESDAMLLEMLAADQSGVDASAPQVQDDSEDMSGNDDEEYNVYDALRKEERSRNSMMRFKIHR